MRIITKPSELPSRLPPIRVLDTETYDPLLKQRGPGWCYNDEGHMIGFSVFCPDLGEDSGFYVPVAHLLGENMPLEAALIWIKEVLYDPDCTIVFANSEYDLGWLRHYGIMYNDFKIEDIQVQAPLIDEHRFSFSLESLSRHNGVAQKNYDVLVQEASLRNIPEKEIMSRLREMDPIAVGEYAVADVVATWENHVAQKQSMEEQNLIPIYTLEMALIPHMIEMRMRGVRIDVERAHLLSAEFLKKENAARDTLHELTGIWVESPWAAKELAKVLDVAGIQYPLTPKTQKPSIKKEWLDSLLEFEASGPVAQAIKDLRRFNKARTTFVEDFFIHTPVNGRVHCNFNLLKGEDGGTISGRLSCDSPNMQQIPARDPEIGPLVRSLVLPEEGCVFTSADYSQQEPRHMVHMAYMLKDASATQLRHQFIINPETDFHQENANLTGLPRKSVKSIGLGLAYGMGGGKLAKQLGLPYTTIIRSDRTEMLKAGPEATAMLNRFHTHAPYIKVLGTKAKNLAVSRGYIRTPLGRVIHFPMRNGEVWKSHKAMNGLIQGMAADETKKAMLDCARAGYLPALQVHDELNFTTFESAADTKVVAQIMLDAMITSVPSKVDIEVGPNWGECALYEHSNLERKYLNEENEVLVA